MISSHLFRIVCIWSCSAILYIQPLLGQFELPDSLLTNPSAEKANYYLDLAKQQSNLDTALLVTQLAIEYASTCDCDTILLLSHYNLSFYPVIHGQYDIAINNMDRLDSLLARKENRYYEFRKYTLLAYAYNLKTLKNLSIENYELALDAALVMNDSLLISDAYNNIGDAFYGMKLNDKARSYFSLALKLFDELGVGEKENRRYIVYSNLMKVAETNEDIEYYANLAFNIIKDDANPQSLTLHYLNKATAYSERKIYNQSKLAAQKGYQYAVEANSELFKNIALLYLGEAQVELKNYDDAISKLEEALTLEQPILENHKIILENISKAYAATNQYQKGYETYTEVSVLADSVYNLATVEKYAEFDVKFDTEKKDKEIAQQELELVRQKNNTDRTIFGGIVALLLASSIFTWYYARSRRKKREAELALILEQDKAEKLKELDLMKSHFFTNISHELRTPLTLIAGPIENSLAKVTDPRVQSDLKLASSNSKKLLGMVDEILDLSKLESGKLTLHKQEVSLYPLVERIFSSFRSFADIRQVSLDLKYAVDQGLVVELDADKFEKILNNLISNAIKHSKKEGQVTLEVSRNEHQFRFSVIDLGSGIQSHELNKIFDRFYQSNQHHASAQGGTGVGLALAKELSKLFGGDISVLSEIGRGSTFTLDIPIQVNHSAPDPVQLDKQLVEEEKTQAIPDIYEPILMNGERPRILIVEDHPEMCAYLKSILGDDYHCQIANDGTEAIKQVQTESFDLITSDVMMPYMDGFEFREKVRKIDRAKSIPFVMITARALEEDMIRGFDLGVDDYILKPFSANALKARIHNLLVNKRERENWLKEQDQHADLEEQTESSEKQLLLDAERMVWKNLNNSKFKVDDLAKALNYSERQLRRVMKKLTGMSPVNFILELRLQKAYQLLESRQFSSIAEVQYAIGIESASYFTSKFRVRFGMSPSELVNVLT